MGQPEASPAVAGQVRAAQIEAVRRYTPWMMAANIANAFVVAAIFFGSPDFHQICAWACCVTGLALYALWIWLARRRASRPRQASARGIRRTVLHTMVLGSLWAILPAAFYADATPDQRLVLGVVTAGMMCGSGFALATIPAAALTFGGLLALGSTYALASVPGPGAWLVIGLNTIYMLVVFRSSLGLSAMLRGRFEAQIQSEEQRAFVGLLLNDFEEHGSDWLWVVDAQGRITYLSSRLGDILQRPVDELIGLPALDTLPIGRSRTRSLDEKRALHRLRKAVTQRAPFRDLELPLEIGGRERLWALTARPVFREDGTFDGYRGVGRDVTRASEARRRIEYMAKYDTLTGLANRASLSFEIAAAFERLHREGQDFALLLLDLDRFKLVNDTQGHPVGDELLRLTAGRLRDLAGDRDTVARVGGDEFALVLANPRNPKDVGDFAQKTVRALSQPLRLSTGEVQIGVSIGIAYAPGEATDVDALVRHADLALYRVKAESRGGFLFFSPELDAAARRRHQLEGDLRAALAADALTLYYQPLVDARTGAVVAFEALVRWRHPEFGFLSPAEFVPLAEEVGLIAKLGRFVLHEACREAAGWPGDIRVAVNLSPIQFRTPSLFADVQEALRASGLAPERLELEVTESVLLENREAVTATLDALRALRTRIALDDFGTGYSSLSYLRELRFDKLKIDRSFIRAIESERESIAIVRAVIVMARELGISVSVEGVETQGQYDAVRRLGCDEVQGYLIAAPMPAARCAEMLEPLDNARHAG